MKLYLDTNIFLNLLFNEEISSYNSEKLLNQINDGIYTGLTSILTIMEIYRVLQKQGIQEKSIEVAIDKILKLNMEIIIPEGYIFIQAYSLIKNLQTDIDDSIHLAIVKENEAILITRDKKLFNKAIKIISVKTPEEILEK